MAYKIDPNTCTQCGACEFECPNGAISMKGDAYAIQAMSCTECAGQFDEPQCESVCPSPGTIVKAA